MPSKPALTIALFGLAALFNGLFALFSPSTSLQFLQLPSTALPPVYASNIALAAVGVYYLLAAYQENKAFFIATVLMRSMTAVAFWTLCQWRTVAIWEGSGAAITAAALLWEVMQTTQVEKKTI